MLNEWRSEFGFGEYMLGLGQKRKFWNLTECILGLFPNAKWFKECIGAPSLAVKLYYISSVNNMVLRLERPRGTKLKLSL